MSRCSTDRLPTDCVGSSEGENPLRQAHRRRVRRSHFLTTLHSVFAENTWRVHVALFYKRVVTVNDEGLRCFPVQGLRSDCWLIAEFHASERDFSERIRGKKCTVLNIFLHAEYLGRVKFIFAIAKSKFAPKLSRRESCFIPEYIFMEKL